MTTQQSYVKQLEMMIDELIALCSKADSPIAAGMILAFMMKTRQELNSYDLLRLETLGRDIRESLVALSPRKVA